ERPLEAGERRLGALRRPPECRLTPARGARLRLALRPAVEQPAEGQRGDLARSERPDQPGRRGIRDAVGAHEPGPAMAVRRVAGSVAVELAHTSTSTGT